MTEKELRKLNRYQLLDILIMQTERADELQQKLDTLMKEKEEQTIQINNLGSVAEAAMHINQVFESVQQAADMYLAEATERAETLERETRERAETLERETREQAETLEREARERAEAMEREARERAETMEQEATERADQIIQSARDKAVRIMEAACKKALVFSLTENTNEDV